MPFPSQEALPWVNDLCRMTRRDFRRHSALQKARGGVRENERHFLLRLRTNREAPTVASRPCKLSAKQLPKDIQKKIVLVEVSGIAKIEMQMKMLECSDGINKLWNGRESTHNVLT